MPVLSEHMTVAFPIVSQARRILTRLCSLTIRVVAKASASVTAKGSPSAGLLVDVAQNSIHVLDQQRTRNRNHNDGYGDDQNVHEILTLGSWRAMAIG